LRRDEVTFFGITEKRRLRAVDRIWTSNLHGQNTSFDGFEGIFMETMYLLLNPIRVDVLN